METPIHKKRTIRLFIVFHLIVAVAIATLVSAQSSDTRLLTLAWDWDYPNETITGFRLYKRISPAETYTHIKNIAFPELLASDNVQIGQRICYQVTAYIASPFKESEPNELCLDPIPPRLATSSTLRFIPPF